ncbi:unnamed protein product [Moneuplotes crassus]|uniref:non-specific serine/threonine protein kinase n=1 Tax=Euplotes crassus TaxID=5936 RepID=A0AAD1Y769_EUPCR|nr:unnamed protein product [Moneuplotes crassus]
MDSESSYASSDNEEVKKEPEVAPTEKVVKKSPKKITIKSFALLGVLGEGSFGTVHHVINKDDGKEYALKIIPKRNIEKKQQNEIQRERSLLMAIDHPNIVKLHYCFHDRTNLYFAMDCCSNGELYTYMRNEGVIDLKVAKFLAAEIVNMITYMMDRNICHRDIKPSNLIFDEEMHLKLIDFGCGKYYADNNIQEDHKPTQSGSQSGLKERTCTFLGTCEYMSPEVVVGTQANSAIDLWSLGVIIYMFFTECSPFRGEYDQETLDKIVEDCPSFPEEFPEDAKDLCIKLLEKDPEKRLGAGYPGSEYDMTALKSHKFFDGIDFDNLFTSTSPIPKIDKMMNSIKSNIISKYRVKNAEEELKSPEIEEPKCLEVVEMPKQIAKAQTSEAHDSNKIESSCIKQKLKIEDWKVEKNITIIHTELIKLRSKLLFFYKSVISIVTDEPALYIYKLRSGNLIERYPLDTCKVNIKGKNKIKITSKTKEKFKKISNAFKVKNHKKHHRDSSNSKSLVEVLKEIRS